MRTLIDKYFDDSVAAAGQSVWESPAIPTGETWHLTKFGGCAVEKGAVALQVWIGAAWVTLRMGVSPGSFEFTVNREYLGDDSIKFRLVRQNKDAAAQPVVVWLEGYKL